jgi:hypothetical protein
MSNSSDDDKVGYGRPPKHTQFKPGRSGNPRGRPKRPGHIKTIAAQLANSPIRARKGDRTTTLSGLEAMMLAVFKKALNGDLKAMAVFMSHLPPQQMAEEWDGEAAKKDLRERMQKYLDRTTDDANREREEQFATRRFVLERGIPEQVVNDGFGVFAMEPEEAEQRQARAIEFMRARGISEDRIKIVEGRKPDGSSRFFRKLEAPNLTGD